MKPTGIAFFDVDETLISVKSMFRFLRFFFDVQGRPPEKYTEVVEELGAMAAAGVPRAATNRIFYRTFAGESVELVAQRGRQWFATESAAAGFFHAPVVSELHERRSQGDLVVLVSGSFRPCLDPIARSLGVDRVECTELIESDGRYTGEVVEPIIGPAKATAALRVLSEFGTEVRRSIAYGDHISDLPMLTAVDAAVVVGDDRHLATHAASAGWRRIAVG